VPIRLPHSEFRLTEEDMGSGLLCDSQGFKT